mgnify:CR=1 FL=1
MISAILLCLAAPVYATQAVEPGDSAEVKLQFKNRIAVRTNALEWLVVIPNIGFEYRLTSNPYRYMTIGLNAKCNWILAIFIACGISVYNEKSGESTTSKFLKCGI